MGSGAILWRYAGRVPRLKLEPCSTILLKRSQMINEHEYFSASSRENRMFQSPGASNAAVARKPPPGMALGLSCPSGEGKGPPGRRGGTFRQPPLPSPRPLLSFLRPGAGGPSLEQGTARLASPRPPPSPSRRAEPRLAPALPGAATLRSKRPALGVGAGLRVPSQSPARIWGLGVGVSAP